MAHMQDMSIAEIRKAMKLTQADFADMLNERQDTISRWESTDPDELSISQKKWKAIYALFEGKVDPLDVADKWRSAGAMKTRLGEYLRGKGAHPDDGATAGMLQGILDNALVKPKVAFIGMSDTGKSTLINSLTGTGAMPADWNPMTAIVVYIKHRDDKPSFIQDSCWVFKDEAGGKRFDLSCLEDEERCKALCVARGDTAILNEYATRIGEKNSDEVAAAVVYLDSPILQNVDLVDLPGFGTGDREADDAATRGVGEYADVLVFLSRSNGFMNGEDLAALRVGLQDLPCFESTENDIPPLGNLFVVASQADIVDNEINLNRGAHDALSRFEKILPCTLKEFFENRSAISGYNTEEYLQSRFFTYSIRNPAFRSRFEDELRALIEKLPRHVVEKTAGLVRDYARGQGKRLDDELASFQGMLDNKEKLRQDLVVLLANEAARKAESQKLRKKLLQSIDRYGEHSRSEFARAYDVVLDEKFIVNAIKEKGFKKKKEDLELLVNFLGAKLERELDQILSKYAGELKSNVEDYLNAFELFTTANGKIAINARIPFDPTRVFISGMAGMLTFGALSLWASTLGNLAGYILVAKGLGVLASIGISLGGAAAVMPFVAAIGGPITLFIVAAIIVSGILFGILAGGWQKNVAKKLIQAYNKADAKRQYEDFIEKFWAEDTAKAFNTAADALERDWLRAIEEHKNLLDHCDEEYIKERMSQIEELKSFLAHIPLEEGGSIS